MFMLISPFNPSETDHWTAMCQKNRRQGSEIEAALLDMSSIVSVRRDDLWPK